MQKNTAISIAIVALVVGISIGAGYQVANRNTPGPGTHMMPNGEMMGNGGSMDMDDMMMSMNAELRGKTGDVFDRAFLAEMIVHHQGAVEMAQLALSSAKHQEIKDLASAIIAAQNKEIAEMREWQKTWYGQ